MLDRPKSGISGSLIIRNLGHEFVVDGQSASTVKALYFRLMLFIPVANFSLSAWFPAEKRAPWLPGGRASRFSFSLSFDISLFPPYGGRDPSVRQRMPH